MAAAQRKRKDAQYPVRQGHDFIAAVRYPDGRRDLFHVRNADDLADARALVISEVGDIRSLVIAQRH